MKLRLHLRFLNIAMWLGLFLTLNLSTAVRAQSCCSGSSPLFPVRLLGNEVIAAGISIDGRTEYGSFTASGKWTAQPQNNHEFGMGQKLLGAISIAHKLQLSLSLPFVETWRDDSGLHEHGGGLGDVQFGARYDVLYAGNDRGLPGVSLLASAILPSGTSVDGAQNPLATDATGQGTLQAALGLAFERFVGSNVVLELATSITGRLPRDVGSVHQQTGFNFQGALSAAWVFTKLQVLALTLSGSRETNASINGESIPSSGRGLTSVGFFGALPLPSNYRLQGSLSADLPISGFGHGQSANGVFTLALLRHW